MILLAGIVLGIVFALVLGGRPARLLHVPFRSGWAVGLALAIQIPLFLPRVGDAIPDAPGRVLHLLTYVFLVFFVWRNRTFRPLLPLGAGMLLNAVAIAANGGRMPLSRSAALSVGETPAAHANVAFSAHRVAFLGDVLALPSRLPLATVVSPGDVLIVVGTIALVTIVALGGQTSAPLDRKPADGLLPPAG